MTTFATEAKAGQRGKVDEGEGQDLKEGDAAKESARVVRQTRLGSGETAACSSRREIGSKPLCNADVDKEITRLKQLLARLEMKSLPRNAVEILERAIILLESPAPGDTAEDLLDDASNSWKAFKKQLLPTAMTPEEDVVVDLVASKLSGPLVELLLSVEERGSKSLESLLGEAGSRARAERRRKREEVAASAITKNAYEWCEARRLAKRRTRTATKKWAPALGALEALTASKTALCLEDWRETVERAPLPSFSVGPLSANFDEAASLRIVAVEERFSEGEDSGSETSIEQEDEEEKDCEAEDVGKECQPKRERPAFWTKHALDWMRSADPKWREMLVKRVGRIVEGERTYAVAKALKGTKRCKLFEAKLDSGMRIIWSESPAIVIWFVVKHDAVSKICRLIDDSERRKISPRVERNDAEIKGPLVDPLSNALLPCYRVQYEDLDRLSKDWQPPFALADDERQLVDSSAMSAILLLGRSGTGKTVCTAMRMSRMAPVASRQLFVARSHRLCQHVRRLLDASAVGDDCEGQSTAETLDLDTFVERMWTHVGHPPTRRREEERRRRRVTYDVFRDRVFQSDKGGIKPLEAWTQIRCFIKGSAEAVLKGRRLEGDEFAANAAFNNRSRLDASGRREALDICDRYDAFLDDHCSLFWDDSDRVRNIASAALLRRRRPRRYEALCDRIYVDECQDLTQAHIILALLAVGGDPSRLWLAGDTAQCVAYGSHFRFADVRSAIHAVVGVSDKLVTNGASAQVKYVAPKVFKLTTNYRTHSGVMSLSARIISCILATFPDTSVDRMLNPESNNFA